MSSNRVRETVEAAADAVEFEHVRIDDDAVRSLAGELDAASASVPRYDDAAYPPDTWDDEMVFDLLVLTAANAFQFIMEDAPEHYRATYDGETWTGMYALAASLTDAVENGVPVTDGAYLRDMTLEETRSLFAGDGPNDTRIPMLEARQEMHNAIGARLVEGYDGRFHDVLAEPGEERLFDGGLVETLVEEFPAAFEDTRSLEGHHVAFDKKAQLAAAYAYGRFQDRAFFSPPDVDQLTMLADYVVPAILRGEGVLVYDDDLADRVDAGTELPAGSREEVEIRAAVILAGDRLVDAIAAGSSRPLALVVDYLLWKRGRDMDIPFHVTHTTTY